MWPSGWESAGDTRPSILSHCLCSSFPPFRLSYISVLHCTVCFADQLSSATGPYTIYWPFLCFTVGRLVVSRPVLILCHFANRSIYYAVVDMRVHWSRRIASRGFMAVVGRHERWTVMAVEKINWQFRWWSFRNKNLLAVDFLGGLNIVGGNGRPNSIGIKEKYYW